MIDLAFIWAGIIAFAVLLYTMLDGFDLGIGILFPFAGNGDNRGYMMRTVSSNWDGNETWLVMGGGGLLAVFPLAYSVIMSALYIPIIVMLLALVFRGVAFEFRWQSQQAKHFWDWGFAIGSTVASFAQGVILGALVMGIPVAGRAYSGGTWDFLSPFSLLTGIAVVVGYALLGSTWLIKKGIGRVQERAYGFARILAPAMTVLIGIISLWTLFLSPTYKANWLEWPHVVYVAIVPLAVLLTLYVLLSGIAKRRDQSPFYAAECLFVLCYIGLGISFYPYMVPNSITIWQAAAPDSSLKFLLVGAVVLIPVILTYSGLAYWVFRGKIQIEDTHVH